VRITVITIAAGRHRHLRRQLDGLAAGSVRPDHHVVVAMGDPAIRRVVAGRAEVVDVEVGDHLPLATARNTGAAHAIAAGADLLVFLDVDCVPGVELISRYRDTAADRTLLCGPVTYLPPGDPPLDRLADLTDPHPGRPAPPDDETVANGDHTLFWSLSFAVTATTWQRLGGFCEDYTGYGGEDTDFGQIARAEGVGLTWVGGAHAYHQHHPVQDPPVDHLDDILVNAALFRRRWGWRPMGGWLDAFADQGLIDREVS